MKVGSSSMILFLWNSIVGHLLITQCIDSLHLLHLVVSKLKSFGSLQVLDLLHLLLWWSAAHLFPACQIGYYRIFICTLLCIFALTSIFISQLRLAAFLWFCFVVGTLAFGILSWYFLISLLIKIPEYYTIFSYRLLAHTYCPPIELSFKHCSVLGLPPPDCLFSLFYIEHVEYFHCFPFRSFLLSLYFPCFL